MKKTKAKTSGIAKAIEDALFANATNDGEVSDDNNEETRAQVVEKDDDDDDIDIFTRDFSAEERKPSRLRILNAPSAFDHDERYKGKKVSRKKLQSALDEDEDLANIENNSDDSEDEALEKAEHDKAELGHMFEMEGVEYEDEDEDCFKKKKYQRSQSPDLEHLEGDSDQGDDISSDEETNEMSQRVKELLAAEKENQDNSSTEEEDTSDNDEQDLEENDDEDTAGKKDFMAEIKKISKDDFHSQSDSGNENDEIPESGSDEVDDDDEMGPDLSEIFKNDDASEETNEVEDGQGIATFTAGNVEKEVAKGKCIQRQLQIWDGLLELRIAMQKSLAKINQFPTPLKPFKEAMPDPNQDGGELKKSQVMLAKTLDQLLELKRQLLEKDPVVVANDEPLGKKRKLNDYDQYLTEGFETMTSWRNETIEDWNDRTRIVGKTGFSAFETSVTRQIEHILADKSRLVKRTKLKRNAYDIIGTETNDDNETYNDEIFDDDDFYHQLLRELIERKTSSVTDPIALGQQWLQLQKVRAKAKKKVDTRASKGRKTRYDIHAKLVNFMAPTYPKSSLSEEAKTE